MTEHNSAVIVHFNELGDINYLAAGKSVKLIIIDEVKAKIDPETVYSITGIHFQPFNLSNQLLWFVQNRKYLLDIAESFLPISSIFFKACFTNEPASSELFFKFPWVTSKSLDSASSNKSKTSVLSS